MAHVTTWTIERRDYLREAYENGTPTTDILAQLKTLPGAPIPSVGAVWSYAATQGYRRSGNKGGRPKAVYEKPHKPLPTAVVHPAKSRDGVYSLAHATGRQGLRENATVWISWTDALTWASSNKIKFNKIYTDVEKLKHINYFRKLYRLPVFSVRNMAV